MNREEAAILIQKYKDFPHTKIFGVKPYNYPLFHLLECFSKGWQIDRIVMTDSAEWSLRTYPRDNIDFERIAEDLLHSERNSLLWTFVARNPNVTKSAIGFVQEDLYDRYVGKCNPLKTPETTWGFIPFEAIVKKGKFRGCIGRNVPLYCLEIDLDTTDIIGERDEKVPWCYLQQTINWKPFTDRIAWQGIQS